MIMKDVTREQVMEQINSLDRNKTSIVADLKNVTDFDVSPGKFDFTLDGKSYHFRGWAQTQLLRKLRIPGNYFNICSEDLRRQEIEEGLENLQRGAENRFKLWLNPETNELEVYGIIPKNCKDVLTSEIMEKVFDGMGSQDKVRVGEFSHTLEEMRIRFISEANSYVEVDEEFPAVDFRFSEVLKCPIQLQSVLFRKVCSNGMVVPTEINQAFTMPLPRFKPDVFDMQIQYVDNSVSGLETIAKTFEALKSVELPEALINAEDVTNLFDDMFEYVLPSKQVRNTYGDLVRAEYNREGNYTVNGLVNATTRIARDLTDSDADKIALESSAGSFVSTIAIRDEQARDDGRTFEMNKDSITRIFKKRKKLSGNANSNPIDAAIN